MSDEELDPVELPEEGASPDTPFRDRTRGRSRYLRKALVRIFQMSPEDRKTYEPKNGWEEAAKAHLDRCLALKGGTAAMAFMLIALGEKLSVNPRDEKADGSAFDGLVDDLPRARKPQ